MLRLVRTGASYEKTPADGPDWPAKVDTAARAVPNPEDSWQTIDDAVVHATVLQDVEPILSVGE